MELQIQSCPQCGSTQLKNILVREPGNMNKVYVLCASCEQPVSRYRLSGYHYLGNPEVSFFRSFGSSTIESGRAALSLAEDEQQAVHKEFQELVEKLTAPDPPGDSDEFPIL